MQLSDKNAKNILIAFWIVLFSVILAIPVFVSVYNRYTFDSIINNGNFTEINNLILKQNFIKYATNEQGKQAIEFVATNIASSSLNEKYDLLSKEAFKKFDDGSIGKLVIASMAQVVLNAPIEERIKFLSNSNTLLYLDDNNRKSVITSIVDFPITNINSSLLDKFFFEICKPNEIEEVFKRIKQNHSDLPKDFIEYLVEAALKRRYEKSFDYLKELLKNYDSAKNYIQIYSYDKCKSYINNNSEFTDTIETLFNLFPWCFNPEVKNSFDKLKDGIKTLNDAERTVNKERVDNELNRLKEIRSMLPKSEYIEGYVHELVFDGSYMMAPTYCYLVTIMGTKCLLITSETKFTTKGYFNMYAYGGKTNDLGPKLRDYCYINDIAICFMEVSSTTRKEREKVTKEINDLERNSKEAYKKIEELKGKLDELKTHILNLIKREINNNLAKNAKQDIDLFVKLLDFEMVKCPAGSFMMGSPEDELGRDSYEILHKVTISKPFFIGKYEVTQKEYVAVMGENPSEFKGDNRPVENIRWDEAKEFCKKLNEIYKDKLPSGYRFDLPTEAQWEYACRAGTTTALNSGKNLTTDDWEKSCPNLDEVAWYRNNSDGTTHIVGQKKPNAWGIYDMHGNVWEMCRDYINKYPSKAVIDPIAFSGEWIASRGGDYGEFCIKQYRSANRYVEDYYDACYGFRLVIVNDETNEERAKKEKREIVITKEKIEELKSKIIPNIIKNMVKCPAGSFTMGSPLSELGRKDNEIQHKVIISRPFYIGKYEVTQKEYEAVMGETPSPIENENSPCCEVSWYDTKEFCNILNEIYKGKLPSGYRFDLPTEAQWEYACRAGTNTALNNGKNLTKEEGACPNLDEVAWYTENTNQYETQPVGLKKPNAWGIYDMHGNVMEWCKDWYSDYTTSSITDPKGGKKGLSRVFRGGSCDSFNMDCRSASRSDGDSGFRSEVLGFRLALVPDESQDISEPTINKDSTTIDNSKESDTTSTNEINNNQNSSNNLQMESNPNSEKLSETLISNDKKKIGIITAKSGVNARKEPNVKAQKVGSFAYNKEVTILDTNGPAQTIEDIYCNWYKVTDGEVTGWCFGGFIRIDN